jgi:outer membrane lipoprotein-sorting protein
MPFMSAEAGALPWSVARQLGRPSSKEPDTAVNILRRLPLYRLLLLCAVVVAVGVSATALAFALGAGPTPPAKPLAQAVHDALTGASGESIEGISASVTWTDRLLEGASLASGAGQGGEGLTQSPLIAGASGRLWIAKDGHVRLELQSEKGDTQVLYDGHTLQVYDAATNTLYRYTPPAHEQSPAQENQAPQTHAHGEVPSVAKIEEAVAHAEKHADVSGATPTDVAGQPAYTVRVSPREGGSLLGGAELSFDADNGVPLRAAVYSSDSSSPVMELAAGEISFGAVGESVLAFTPPPNAEVQEVTFSRERSEHGSGAGDDAHRPKLTTQGHGPSTVAVLETTTNGDEQAGTSLEGLPKVTIDGASASELKTELGTLLTFERSGVRYLVAGAVPATAVEEVARGL